MPLRRSASGGGDDAGVDINGLASADAFDAFFLEETEELDLERERNFADFVQEEGAAAGAFKAAFALGMGAGEGAFFVAEQFAFEEGFRNGAAIDGDEGGRLCVRCFRWMARAAISLPVPLSPRRRTGASVVATLRMDSKTARMLALVPIMPSKDLPPSNCCMSRYSRSRVAIWKELLRSNFSSFHIDGFAEEIVRAGTDGLEGDVAIALAGDDDDFGQAIDGENLGEGGEAFFGVAGMRGQAQVKQNGEGPAARNFSMALGRSSARMMS